MFKRIRLALDRVNYKKMYDKQTWLLKQAREALNAGKIEATNAYIIKERDINDSLIKIERRYNCSKPGNPTQADKLIAFFFGK